LCVNCYCKLKTEMKIDILAITIVFCSFLASTNGWRSFLSNSLGKGAPNCMDRRPDCNKMRADGRCKTHQKIVARVCRKTCYFCGECRDKRPDCNSLAAIGYCKSHPNFMGKSCPKRCGLCKNKQSNKTKRPTQVQKISQKAKLASCKYARDLMGKAKCQYYKYIGWCEERKSMKYYCKKSCVCERTDIPMPSCSSSQYGCCWDKETTKLSPDGEGCPACADDRRFQTLCNRFKRDCHKGGNLGKSLMKYCPKSCLAC